jgi:tRNA A37 methylthiotransferase MiaB
MDVARLIKYLRVNDWSVSKDIDEADMILLGACGLDKYNEDKSMKYLSIINKKKHNANLIVIGCLPGTSEERINENFNVVTIPPRDLEKMDKIINATTCLHQTESDNIIKDNLDTLRGNLSFLDTLFVNTHLGIKYPHRILNRLFLGKAPTPISRRYDNVFYINIARGCMGECRYCAIKFAYGPLISKPLDNIVNEFRTGLEKGYGTFKLIAGDVGSYGQDIGTNIVELLRYLFEHKGKYKLIWDDFNPRWLIKYFPELSEIIRTNNRKIGYVGFPVQSGSEKILQLMRRGHTAEDAKKCFIALQQASPRLDMITHVIVGFPGEEDGDLAETIRFLQDVSFKEIHVFPYSDRPNTHSEKLLEKVPEKVKYKRAWKIRKKFQ